MYCTSRTVLIHIAFWQCGIEQLRTQHWLFDEQIMSSSFHLERKRVLNVDHCMYCHTVNDPIRTDSNKNNITSSITLKVTVEEDFGWAISMILLERTQALQKLYESVRTVFPPDERNELIPHVSLVCASPQPSYQVASGWLHISLALPAWHTAWRFCASCRYVKELVRTILLAEVTVPVP
jgi:hypothetical protein